ncbi:DUF1737 domain-containing protein [Paracoccus albus]|uniref:DUF1737 domain-containing protein n=1 Tax=Paracoccus albus TaxID=3017784 RepID=UPI0022F0BDFD|nr:DUF1737 domain-containing protein [Paracoccus albus]WBU60949.1 DUF1737 domain-containing protein [Paracoccus albus]
MATVFRFLTEDDTSAFCHKVSAALDKGWVLHGQPVMAFDPIKGIMRCGQGVTKEIDGAYSPDMKLGEQ